jgi:nucleoid-associated protein YgaU
MSTATETVPETVTETITHDDAERAAAILNGVGTDKPTRTPAPRGPAKTGNPQADRTANDAKATKAAERKAAADAKAAAKVAAEKAAAKAAKDAERAAAKAAKAAKPDTRAGKRTLALLVVQCLGEQVKSLTREQLAEIGMTKAEAAIVVSSWVHHIPADHVAWVKSLPAPDRSDWR